MIKIIGMEKYSDEELIKMVRDQSFKIGTLEAELIGEKAKHWPYLEEFKKRKLKLL